ncbi:hypothetical protein FM103_03770 [Corynebacterium xerosis]|nr:hypothetical protein FM103_03770 [Corynebacterium xerosis]
MLLLERVPGGDGKCLRAGARQQVRGVSSYRGSDARQREIRTGRCV